MCEARGPSPSEVGGEAPGREVLACLMAKLSPLFSSAEGGWSHWDLSLPICEVGMKLWVLTGCGVT